MLCPATLWSVAWLPGGTQRAVPLPPDWRARVAFVLRRDRLCRYRCGRPSAEVHHTDPDTHDVATLAGVCVECHAAVTRVQARQGYARWRARGRRPPEHHPGLR